MVFFERSKDTISEQSKLCNHNCKFASFIGIRLHQLNVGVSDLSIKCLDHVFGKIDSTKAKFLKTSQRNGSAFSSQIRQTDTELQ